MRIIRHFHTIPDALRGAVIAVGNFDGVHAGHQALIREAKLLARATGKLLAILTFEPHPRRVFQPESPPIRLTRFAQKARLLEELGVDVLFVQRFTKDFAGNSARAFIETILVAQLGASHIITGAEFVFGQGRQGGAALLGEYAARGAFGYTPFVPVESGGEHSAQKISSSRIRALLAQGECEAATELLGRPFSIKGCVMHGDKRGRLLGFPTANLALHKRFVPKFGVYAVKVQHDNEFCGVANIGIRPMYEIATPLLEVHLFDFTGDLYGRMIEVECLHYLRAEAKFDSENALVAAMKDDAQRARNLLEKKSS